VSRQRFLRQKTFHRASTTPNAAACSNLPAQNRPKNRLPAQSAQLASGVLDEIPACANEVAARLDRGVVKQIYQLVNRRGARERERPGSDIRRAFAKPVPAIGRAGKPKPTKIGL